MRNPIEEIRPEFVDLIPRVLEPGVVYISNKYRTASHLCACGCGEKVVTPISPADWQMTCQNGYVSLHPSIGNWNYNCRSHYWIRRNKVSWSGQMSEARIAFVQGRDRLDKLRQVEKQNSAKLISASTIAAQPVVHENKTPSLGARLWAAITCFLQGG